MAELRLTRTLPSHRERVWHAWTDANELERWFWPPSFATVATSTVAVGGHWRIASEAMGMAASGEYRTVDAGSQLTYTWCWDGEDEQTLVTVSFADTDADGTLLTLTHSGFATDDGAANHVQGWNDCLDRLPDSLR